MIKSIYRVLIYLIYFLLSVGVYSQDSGFSFEIISKDSGLSNQSINTSIQDSQGFLWFGTVDGLNMYDGYDFKVYKRKEKDLNSISSNIITTIFEDSKKDLWIGTNSGLNKYYSDTDKFIRYSDKLSNNHINYICETNQAMWIATINGLIRLNKIDESIEKFYIEDSSSKKSDRNNFLSVIPDNNGFLWVGTKAGLYKMNIERGNFKLVSIFNGDNSLIVRDLFFDSSGLLWISTNNGLYTYNTKLNHPKRVKVDDNDITFAYEDKEGGIWIGTTSSGLFYISKLADNTKSFYNDDSILSVVEDNTGILWFGTSSRGIIKYNQDKNTELNESGGGNSHPILAFTSFKLDNQEVEIHSNSILTKNINRIDSLKLKDYQNNISLEFSALDFTNSKKNQYQYKLEGFDKEWIHAGTRRYISYTNLNPGEYILYVKGSNSKGVWNKEPRSLTITILPSIWKGNYAAILYLLILILFIFIWRLFIIKRQKELFEKQKTKLKIDNLKKANEQKSQFFINLTHEFKTPLTLIDNYFSSYLEKVEITNELKIIHNNIKKISNDLVNFLDSEKLEKGIEIYNHDQTVSFSNMLKQKILLFRELANNKNISIYDEIEENLFIKIDPVAIDRIMSNLIENSIKYTDNGGYIKLCLFSDRDKIVFEVEDNGIGIAEEQQKHIFSPFYQISNKKRNIQGIGMGLNIVKEIMTTVDGTISLESKLNHGTIFTLSFKRSLQKAGIESEEYMSIPVDYWTNISHTLLYKKGHQHSILIVEDNIDLLNFLNLKLSDKFNIYTASDGKRGLEVLNKNSNIDLIVTDVMMDVMDGYEFYTKIREVKNFETTPVIFMSAKTTESDRIKGLASGAIDYLYKPFNIIELICKINSIFNYSSKIKEKSFRDDKSTKENRDMLLKKYLITKRESEVINLVRAGRTNNEISDELKISEGTVRKHMDNIFRKCGIHNRIELANTFSVV